MAIDDAPAAQLAIAELAWSGSGCDAFAVVRQPAHVQFLTQQCRIVGVAAESDAASVDSDAPTAAIASAGSAPLLRLRLEEIYVGLYHGFLALQQPAAGGGESSSLDAFRRELLRDADSRDSQHAMIKLRLCVFRDLWERGYFVAFGSKFSADFIIYEDAPARTHATALVIVKAFDAPFASVDVASHCRVAKMVRKQLFFASQRTSTSSSAIVYVAVNHALLTARQDV